MNLHYWLMRFRLAWFDAFPGDERRSVVRPPIRPESIEMVLPTAEEQAGEMAKQHAELKAQLEQATRDLRSLREEHMEGLPIAKVPISRLPVPELRSRRIEDLPMAKAPLADPPEVPSKRMVKLKLPPDQVIALLEGLTAEESDSLLSAVSSKRLSPTEFQSGEPRLNEGIEEPLETPTIEFSISEERIARMITCLQPDQQTKVLLQLVERAVRSERQKRMRPIESRLVDLARLQGLEWEQMSERERDDFVDRAIHDLQQG